MAQIFHYICKLHAEAQTILRQNFKSLFVAWRDNVASPAEAASAAATATKSGITCYATKEEEKQAASLQAVLEFCSKMSSTESARPTQARSKISAAQFLQLWKLMLNFRLALSVHDANDATKKASIAPAETWKFTGGQMCRVDSKILLGILKTHMAVDYEHVVKIARDREMNAGSSRASANISAVIKYAKDLLWGQVFRLEN